MTAEQDAQVKRVCATWERIDRLYEEEGKGRRAKTGGEKGKRPLLINVNRVDQGGAN